MSEIKDKIKEIRAEYFKDEKWFDTNEEVRDADLLEFLTESETVHEEVTSRSRWWNNVWRVAKLDDNTFIAYDWAKTTGDMNAHETGWEFDWDSVREVEPYQETIVITKYRNK